jgi:YHS domain-containing protein
MAKDPVCGMEVDENKATQKTLYKGRTYYFCSASDKKEFDKNPSKYVQSEGEIKK